MKTMRYKKAFTLVELLITMVVTGIILSAVTTLAFAMSSASRASDDVVYNQTQLRTATAPILDLVRHSRLICAEFTNNLVIWRADDNHNDLIDVNEVAYLEYDGSNDVLTLWEFVLDPADNTDVLAALGLPAEPGVLAELAKAQTKADLIEKYLATSPPGVRRITLLRRCARLQFVIDVQPPRTRRVVLSFTLTENGSDHDHEIDATMRVSGQHLLSGEPARLVSDDD